MVLHDRLCLQTWDLGADTKTEDDEVIRCCVCVCVLCAQSCFVFAKKTWESIEWDETVESSNDEVMRLREKPDLGIWN
jgi:thermostable 8-oxoguanine DNA glycosylase